MICRKASVQLLCGRRRTEKLPVRAASVSVLQEPGDMITHRSQRGRRSCRALLACLVVTMAAPSAAQVRVDHGRHTRLQRFARDMAFGTAEGLALAGVDQARNRLLEWGTGTAGYGRRAASNVGAFVIQEGVTEGLAAALKHPLDYTPCQCAGTPLRIGHVLLGVVADEEPGGAYAFATENCRSI